jgi:hypothetical protein
VQNTRLERMKHLIDVQGLFESVRSGDPEFQIRRREKQNGRQQDEDDDPLYDADAAMLFAHAVVLATT